MKKKELQSVRSQQREEIKKLIYKNPLSEEKKSSITEKEPSILGIVAYLDEKIGELRANKNNTKKCKEICEAFVLFLDVIGEEVLRVKEDTKPSQAKNLSHHSKLEQLRETITSRINHFFKRKRNQIAEPSKVVIPASHTLHVGFIENVERKNSEQEAVPLDLGKQFCNYLGQFLPRIAPFNFDFIRYLLEHLDLLYFSREVEPRPAHESIQAALNHELKKLEFDAQVSLFETFLLNERPERFETATTKAILDIFSNLNSAALFKVCHELASKYSIDTAILFPAMQAVKSKPIIKKENTSNNSTISEGSELKRVKGFLNTLLSNFFKKLSKQPSSSIVDCYLSLYPYYKQTDRRTSLVERLTRARSSSQLLSIYQQPILWHLFQNLSLEKVCSVCEILVNRKEEEQLSYFLTIILKQREALTLKGLVSAASYCSNFNEPDIRKVSSMILRAKGNNELKQEARPRFSFGRRSSQSKNTAPLSELAKAPFKGSSYYSALKSLPDSLRKTVLLFQFSLSSLQSSQTGKPYIPFNKELEKQLKEAIKTIKPGDFPYIPSLFSALLMLANKSYQFKGYMPLQLFEDFSGLLTEEKVAELINKGFWKDLAKNLEGVSDTKAEEMHTGLLQCLFMMHGILLDIRGEKPSLAMKKSLRRLIVMQFRFNCHLIEKIDKRDFESLQAMSENQGQLIEDFLKLFRMHKKLARYKAREKPKGFFRRLTLTKNELQEESVGMVYSETKGRKNVVAKPASDAVLRLQEVTPAKGEVVLRVAAKNFQVAGFSDGESIQGKQDLFDFINELQVFALIAAGGRVSTDVLALRRVVLYEEKEQKKTKQSNILCYGLAVEYTPKGTLEAYLYKRRARKDYLKEACSLAYDLVTGLDYLHESGIVHAGVHPSNVVLVERGNKLVAKLGGYQSSFVEGEESRGISVPVEYRAPEQLKSKRQPCAKTSDVWSCFILLIYLFTGKAPFENLRTGRAVSESRMQGFYQEKKLENVNNWLSLFPSLVEALPEVGQIIHCVDPNPEKRPKTSELVAFFKKHKKGLALEFKDSPAGQVRTQTRIGEKILNRNSASLH